MKVKISQTGSKVVTVNKQGTTEVISIGIQGPAGTAGSNNISNAVDVDSTDIQNGSVLIYNTSTNKWTATTIFDAQNIEGGEF